MKMKKNMQITERDISGADKKARDMLNLWNLFQNLVLHSNDAGL